MNYNFTDRVRKVLAMAREEAIRLQHDYVGTEHILLGLIREGEGVAAAVLTNLNVDLDQMVRRVIQFEVHFRQVLLRDARAVTEDKIWRAYGLLRYARTLSFEELMNLLSGVRLGASLKLLQGLRVYTLHKLMIFTQPAHLEQAAGRDLPPPESDAHRAAYVRRVLATEGNVEPDYSPGGVAPEDHPK